MGYLRLYLEMLNGEKITLQAEIFGNSIFSYIREKTIRDGVLVDISETAVEAGIIFSTTETRVTFRCLQSSLAQKIIAFGRSINI